jgi:hypothetical protein
VSVDDDERRAAKESPRRLDRYLDVVIEMTPLEAGADGEADEAHDRLATRG